MPICPNCHTDQKKRQSGRCPNCQVEVSAYGDRWFRTGIGNPAVNLVNEYFRLLSKRENAKRTTASVVVTVPKKSPIYKRYLVTAERLLQDADYDYNMALDALSDLFENKRTSWKNLDFLYLESDFLVALAIVKANREEQRKQVNLVQGAVKNLHRVDVFERRNNGAISIEAK